jgi:phosphatidylglycerol:prolipoprotein diacylglycerol transferase
MPIKILFEIGPFKIKSYGLMLALAFLFVIIYVMNEAKKRKIDLTHIYWLALISIFFGFIGGRLLYVVFNLSYYISNPIKIFAIWDGGGIFYGGLILGILTAMIYLKIKKQSIALFFDMIAPSMALGIAVTRIGCFLNWCCYGIASNLPWAVKVGTDIARHPTQLYSVIANFSIFLFLHHINKRKKLNGLTSGLFLIFYGIFRFLIEFIRYYDKSFYFGLFTLSQVISLILIIIGFVVLKKGN